MNLPRLAQCGRGILLRPATWLCGVLLLTVLLYLPGLHGPFLLDDTPNIVQPIQAWLAGLTGWRDIVLGNHSGLLHRPIAMASFLANAATTGLAVWPFKFTNLAIHLTCGVLVYLLLARLLTRDPHLRTQAKVAALAVAALWLLHPLQVSTVLYVVQRMAQLSALFMLAGLLSFVHARCRLIEGRTRSGMALLWLGVPLATLAAMFSKENGALLPLLCGVLEWGYFRSIAPANRPRNVVAFFAIFLLLPAVFVLYWYGLHPERLLGGYAGRTFTLGQRLLSEPRALMDYMGDMLLPRGLSMGVYTDDFFASRGLLSPPGTLFTILGLGALVVAAWRSRRVIPAFSTGIFFYLAGQAMESTVFPLELYFEHRNYLPSVGFFLAVVGIAAWLAPKVLVRSDNAAVMRRVLLMAVIAVFVLLSAGSYACSLTWSSRSLLAAHGAREHPQSMRAQLDYADVLLQGRDITSARRVFVHLLGMRSPEARHVGAIDLVALDCITDAHASDENIQRMGAFAGDKLQLGEMRAFENLGEWLQTHPCKNLDPTRLGNIIVSVVDAAPQPPEMTPIWRSRFVASELYVKAGALKQAANQAAMAWATGAADPAVGLYLTAIYLAEGDEGSAHATILSAHKRIQPWDRRNLELLGELEQKLVKKHQKGDGG